MNTLLDHIRTLRFLWTMFRTKDFTPSERINMRATGLDFEADLFYPKHRKPPYPAFLFCQGMTELGGRDPRIRRIAFGLSRAGYFVCVPTFPMATQLRIDPEMPAQLIDLFSTMILWPRVISDRSGFFGVSHGGTLSFLAASHASIRNRVAFIVSIGAYASLEKLISYCLDGGTPPPNAFLRDVLLKNLWEGETTPPTTEAILQRSRGFIERVSISKLFLAPTTRVLLMHSESDDVIPCTQLDILKTELQSSKIQPEAYRVNLSGHAQLRLRNFLGFLYKGSLSLVKIGKTT